jgi:ATP-dependent RNA helicase DDX19/DBP5
MTSEGHKVDSLHGKLETADRDRTIDAFRDGKSKGEACATTCR